MASVYAIGLTAATKMYIATWLHEIVEKGDSYYE